MNLLLRLREGAAVVTMAAVLTGCVAHCPADAPDAQFASLWSDFSHDWHPPRAQIREVRYFTKSLKRPPVLVLHEFPALSSQTLEFAKHLSSQGFSVYVPVLFGNRRGLTKGAAPLGTVVELATSPDWNVTVSQRRTSKISDELRLLCSDISERHGGAKIGVVGMCLTGALPIALMSEGCVAAPVVAQPSAPLLSLTANARASLSISDAELDAAAARGIDVLAVRYELDRISPKEKLDTLRAKLGRNLCAHVIGKEQYAPHKLSPKSHATFTQCTDTPPAREAFKKLVDFLKARI